VPDKDNKSKVEFVQYVNTAESNDNLALTLVQNNLINIKAIQKAKFVLKKIERKDQKTFKEKADKTDNSKR
jgi:hypothetical protein